MPILKNPRHEQSAQDVAAGTDSNSGAEAGAPPFVRERAGENILFGARVRCQAAERKVEALTDLKDRDCDNASRIPLKSSLTDIGVGRELVPAETELRDTVTNPDYVAADASRDRLQLLHRVDALELGLDAADTIEAKNSLEKMAAHQMAVLHKNFMKMAFLMDDMRLGFPHIESLQTRNTELCRLANTMTRIAATYQQGLLAIARIRSGGSQTVHVHHHHQNVQVNDGGQAVVAGKVRTGGRSAIPEGV